MNALALLLVLSAGFSPDSLLLHAAEADLQARFPSQAHRFEVRLTHPWPSETPLSAPQISWPRHPEVPKGRLQVEVIDGGIVRGRAWIFVAHFDSVVIAREALSADQPIDASTVDVVWQETTRQTSFLTARMLADTALVAARSVPEGRIVRLSDVRPPDAVQPGDLVRLTLLRNGMAFLVDTQARQRGHIGQVIRVFSPDTRATYLARITHPGEARWVRTL